jgi:uncharacterized protein
MLTTYLPSLAGGIIIGLSSWLVLVSLGRVTGISGIAGGAVFAVWLNIPVPAPRSSWLLIAAGLLVGFGTVIGSGCTSGHGVCGLGRRSVRSLVATCVFMVMGALTVWISK